MPELQLDYAPTPPWLAPNTDNTAFTNLLAATSSAQQGQQLNAQAKALAVRLKTEQQNQLMNDLKLGEESRQRDQLLEAELAAQGLGDEIAPMLAGGKPLDAMQALLAQGVRRPILFKSPQWQTMMKEVQAAATAETARLQLGQQKLLQESQIRENNAQAEWAQARADEAEDVGAGGIETFSITNPATGEPTGDVAIRVPGSKSLHISRPPGLSRMEEIDYRALVTALHGIDRELAKEPPISKHGLFGGALPDKITDKRAELLEQRAVVAGKLAKFGAAESTAGNPPLPPSPAAAIPPPAQRTPGQIYQTPKGPLKWTGTGWVAP